MLRRSLLSFALLMGITTPAFAQDAAEQAFIDYQTARAIDAKCHFLRYFELTKMRDIELNLLQPLWFTGAKDAGKIDDAQYLEAYEKLAAMGRDKAQAIACSDEAAAAPYILKLRDLTAVLIYIDLIIAFDGNRLSDEQRQAAQVYEAMISPLYGENWQRFADYARGQAQLLYNEAADKDDEFNPLAGLFADDPETMEALYGPAEDGVYVSSLREGAMRIIDMILFDLMAAEAGYRVKSEYLPDDTAVDMLVGADGNTRAYVTDIPHAYETLEQAGPVNLVVTVTPEEEIRIMSWGEKARSLLADGSVTFLVNPNKLNPEEATGFSYMRTQDWLDDALIFTARPVDEPCLGGPCFALPKEALDAILAGSVNQAYRFFVSSQPAPALPSPDTDVIHTGYTYMLVNWLNYREAASQ